MCMRAILENEVTDDMRPSNAYCGPAFDWADVVFGEIIWLFSIFDVYMRCIRL